MHTKPSERNHKLNDTNISIKEFDTLEGKHEFSEKYEKKKQKMLEALQEREGKSARRFYKIAAAAAVAVIIIPSAVYAGVSAHMDFFDSLFGNSTRKNIDAAIVETDNGTVYYPEVKYVPVDPEEAEALIGDNVDDQPVMVQLGEHTLTITSVVYSKHTAQLAFTLEREGGITLFECFDPVFGNIGFKENADYYFDFGPAIAEHYYMDIEKSTSDKWYCYAYMGSMVELKGLKMKVTHYTSPEEITEEDIAAYQEAERSGELLEKEIKGYYDAVEQGDLTEEEAARMENAAREEWASGDHEYLSREQIIEALTQNQTEIEGEFLVLTDRDPVQETTFVSQKGGILSVSPVSIAVDMSVGFGLEGYKLKDPGSINRIEIHYQDGSTYVVKDAEASIDNTGCGLGFDTTDCVAFNRLVNVDEIDSIVVNDVEYRLP